MKHLGGYAWSLSTLALATALGLLLFPFLGSANLAMLYLLAVMAVALRIGRTGAVISAVAGALCFNFFFTEPRFSFAMFRYDEIVTLVVYLFAAVVTGRLGTQLKEAQERRAASEAEQLRAALLSSVSHDLRTPLAAILGSATSLRSQDAKLDSASRSELLETIEEEAERLNRFVQNLLDMAKLGHGKLEPKREWCDLQDLLQQARLRLRRQIEHLRIEAQAAPDVGLVLVDPMLMEQVLVNVLDNAAKYSPRGGVIGISLRRERTDVVMDVEDQGPGIAADDRERVFDPFHRVHSRDRIKPGTGLGLSICRGLLAAHGGRIEALGGSNGGALIRLTIPASRQADVIAHA